MKKIYLIMISLLLIISSCSYNEKELFEKTDYFIESLETTYNSYGISTEFIEFTSDGLYQINPVGRLINVRIQKVVDIREYENLKQKLEKHYKNNKSVNKIYICRSGTIMIDCKN